MSGLFIAGVLSLIAFIRVMTLSARTRRLEDRLASLEKEMRKDSAPTEFIPTELVPTELVPTIPVEEGPSFAPPLEEAAPFMPAPETAAVEDAAALEAALASAVAEEAPVFAAPAAPAGDSFIRGSFKRFIAGGNLWAAGGVILLTAAFGMLIAYLGRHGFFTVEMGIAAAAFTGLVLIFSGWGLRKKRPVYFLILQGGGIGILYLSVFAAHKLTPYFSAPLAFVLMSLLIPPALVLALSQHSQPLAVFGFLGGFAAPILLSQGGGSFLFSYYLILNAGVFAIAFFRSWKALNLLAFVCTFGVSIYWTLNSYTEALFFQGEPFFVIFILFYTVLGLKSVQKADFALNHWSDGIIILGTPFAAAFLQWKVFSFVSHGHAVIALVFSAFYLALTTALLRRGKKPLVLPYAEGYLGLSVLLANIAIPLELSPEITSALWAAEGTVIFFFGLRINRRKASRALLDWKIEASGLLIHFASVAAFFAGLSRFSGGFLPWSSPAFLGSLVIALSALVMVILANKFPSGGGEKFTPVFSVIAVIWALAWWLGGWRFEMERVLDNPGEAFFILLSFTALGTYGAARFFRSSALYIGLVPAPVFALMRILWVYSGRFYYFDFREIFGVNFFSPLWRLGWICFFALQVLLVFLTLREKGERKKSLGLWLFTDLFIALAVLCPSGRYLTAYLELSVSWTSFAGLLPLFGAMIFLSLLFPGRLKKQLNAGEKKLVLFALPLILSLILGLWFLVTLFMPGDPAPLPLYVPLVNPLDLLEGFCIGVTIFWLLGLRTKGGGIPAPGKPLVFVLADVAVFVWFIAILARSVHFYGAVPFRGVLGADAFHLSLFIFCALYGIAHIIGGRRLPRRGIWIAGAMLTAADIAKLLLFDMAGAGVPYRILSFFIAGFILLFIGWAAPLPPVRQAEVRPGEKEQP